MVTRFLQLQAGEILRSSNISSTAADLLQARQQITLYQQQLDEKDAQVRGHQEKTQEQLLLIAQLQERLSEAERVSRVSPGCCLQSCGPASHALLKSCLIILLFMVIQLMHRHIFTLLAFATKNRRVNYKMCLGECVRIKVLNSGFVYSLLLVYN